jgi:hypothetical protein
MTRTGRRALHLITSALDALATSTSALGAATTAPDRVETSISDP